MQPPWIFLYFFLILLPIACWTSGASMQNETKEDYENSTNQRVGREINERERRLIPYMMYYVTQSLTNPNSGARQNVFIPITTSPQNILHYDAAPQNTVDKLQNINSQQLELLTKSVVQTQNPQYITGSTFQVPQPILQEKPKQEEIRVFEQTYPLQTTAHRSPIPSASIQTNVPFQQVIKTNPVSNTQRYSTPQLIKIIPYTPTGSNDESFRTYSSPRPQYVYTATKLQSLSPNSYTIPNQNYYKEPATNRPSHSYDENKVFVNAIQHDGQYGRNTEPVTQRIKNEYTVAKIYSTTSSPHASKVKFQLSEGIEPKIFTNVNVNAANNIRHQSSANTKHLPALIAANVGPNFITTEKHPSTSTSKEQGYYVPGFNHEEKIQETQELVQRLPRLRVPQEEDFQFVATVTPITITNELGTTGQAVKYKESEEGKYGHLKKPTLSNLLSILKETNKLPQTLTPENIDSGIKILAYILERLQQEKDQVDFPTILPPSASIKHNMESNRGNKKKVESFPQPSGTSTPGRPGIDYPTYSTIPQTAFDCSTQRYKGFFGDPETKCQVWHYCDLNGGQASFLCPNGTIFNQVALTCDWWFNVKCATTSQLYVLNERLYKYILPFSPSFPEDYSGPVVDRYLSAKFKEMEAKSKIKALKSLMTTSKPDTTTGGTTEAFEESRTITTEI